MSNAAENDLETGLYNKLKGDTALATAVGGTASPRIYNLRAPQDATLPYLTYNLQGGGDENVTPKRSGDWVYNVVTRASTLQAAGSIDGLVYTALANQALTVSGWTNWRTWREGSLREVEDLGGGNEVHHVASLYRISAVNSQTTD